jgi:hypothetical protein
MTSFAGRFDVRLRGAAPVALGRRAPGGVGPGPVADARTSAPDHGGRRCCTGLPLESALVARAAPSPAAETPNGVAELRPSVG